MNNVDKMRSNSKRLMLEIELEKNVEIGEVSTNIGTVYVTFKGDRYISLFDSDKNWLFPIETEDDVDKLSKVKDITDFAELYDFSLIVYSDNQQELVEASHKAGLEEYDLFYRIGNIYFMFDTPELMVLSNKH